MKRIKVILKSSRELCFDVDEGKGAISDSDTVTTDVNGTLYFIPRGAAEAVTATPMIKCPSCGKWTVPIKETLCGDSENPMMQKVEEKKVCEYCRATIDD